MLVRTTPLPAFPYDPEEQGDPLHAVAPATSQLKSLKSSLQFEPNLNPPPGTHSPNPQTQWILLLQNMRNMHHLFHWSRSLKGRLKLALHLRDTQHYLQSSQPILDLPLSVLNLLSREAQPFPRLTRYQFTHSLTGTCTFGQRVRFPPNFSAFVHTLAPQIH
jgi:hypothetical protein